MMQNNRFAVVTGASSGIGFSLAKKFAENNFDLLVAAEREDIFSSAEKIKVASANPNINVEPFQVDLTHAKGVDAFYDKIKSMHRTIDAIALNAGVGVTGSFVKDISLEDDLNLIGLNVISIVHLSKLVLPEMVALKQGRILITASIASLMPGPFYATYAASKAFLLSFAEALHHELKGSNVTVTALMPGATDTNFFARAGMENARSMEKDDPDLVAKHGFEALMAGKDHVVAGSMKNRWESFFTRFLTEQQRAKLNSVDLEPHKKSITEKFSVDPRSIVSSPKKSFKNFFRKENETGDIVDLILSDHRSLKRLLKTLRNIQADESDLYVAYEEFVPLLLAHTQAEEKSVYAAMKKATNDKIRTHGFASHHEHVIAETQIKEIKDVAGDDEWRAHIKVLAELVEHHLLEEESIVLKAVRKEFSLEDRLAMGDEYLRLYVAQGMQSRAA